MEHGRHGTAWVDYENQDSRGMAHLFNRIGHPWLAQKWVRTVHEAVFTDTSPMGGYHGDEDQGPMGSLSALTAMGHFQLDGGSSTDPEYDITAPIFDTVTINLSEKYYGGKTFTVVAKNQGDGHIYIQSAKWNGRPWNRCTFPHAELVRGGTLELTLGPAANKAWGAIR